MASKEAFKTKISMPEALEASIDKRKLLLKKVYIDTRVTNTMENDSK